jgi:hypothetical protein
LGEVGAEGPKIRQGELVESGKGFVEGIEPSLQRRGTRLQKRRGFGGAPCSLVVSGGVLLAVRRGIEFETYHPVLIEIVLHLDPRHPRTDPGEVGKDEVAIVTIAVNGAALLAPRLDLAETCDGAPPLLLESSPTGADQPFPLALSLTPGVFLVHPLIQGLSLRVRAHGPRCRWI